jgi:hypothetical protein
MKHRLNGPRIRARDIASMLSIRPFTVTVMDADGKPKPKVLQPEFLANHVMQAVTYFCRSADDEPDARHFPKLDGPSNDDDLAVRRALLPKLRAAWTDLTRPDGRLPYKHDHYLAAWAITHPRLRVDYILVDEGQDLNARLAQIVQDQIGHSQVVVVGDQFQQIYEWMGSVDALAKFNFPSKAHLTTSFRFGPPIAEVANLILAELGCTLKVTGSSIPSAIGSLEKPVAILTRTNATGISQLLSAQEVGKRAHLIGGGADVIAFAEAARDLQAGIGTQHPDLACFDSWQDVKHYVGEDGEEGGADLRLLVKIVDTYGPEKIITALRHQPEEKAAELVISTAHKAKGRTFDTVQMAGDFPADRKFDPEADDKRPVTAEDLRLFYVGCTRARYQLDIDALPGLKEAYGRIAGAAAVDEGALRDQAGPVLDVDRNADEDGLRPDHRRAEPTSGSEAVCTSTDLHADTGTDPSRTGDQPSLREPELRQPEAPGSGDAQREHAGDVPQRRRTVCGACGRPYDRKDYRGRRECSTCRKAAGRRYRAKKLAAGWSRRAHRWVPPQSR